MNLVSKSLIFLGICFILSGIIYHFFGKYLPPLGKLPGDIYIKGKNSSFYFPITSCVIVSLILILLGQLWRFFNKL